LGRRVYRKTQFSGGCPEMVSQFCGRLIRMLETTNE
jgi:hypothetical protein